MILPRVQVKRLNSCVVFTDNFRRPSAAFVAGRLFDTEDGLKEADQAGLIVGEFPQLLSSSLNCFLQTPNFCFSTVYVPGLVLPRHGHIMVAYQTYRRRISEMLERTDTPRAE